jgi:hypothetical protein
MTRASELADGRPELPHDPLRDAVARYLEAEVGEELVISKVLRAGIAYHHSGMSQEARALIECLVRRGLVDTVCGTTTLAQGVNFPISNVLIETRRKGRDAQLTYADLWNVIGRAGRALVDEAGLVVFPVATQTQKEQWQTFLRGEAREIASQLTDLVQSADELTEFGLGQIRNMPELGDMLQFLAHAMRVGGARQTAAELEDLLRSSLVYRQASAEAGGADPLINLCRRYLAQIADQPGSAALSDQTGFSTPSIGLVLASRADDATLTDPDAWQPGALFGQDTDALTARMRVLGGVPELGLGWEAGGTFNPWRAGQIVAGWVNGRSLADLATEFGTSDGTDREHDLADFAKNLYSNLAYKASWGLGALEAAYLPVPEEPDPADDSRYVPSMVYFGVASRQAVWMRMAGLPRIAAEAAGALWSERVGEPPTSHAQLRTWLNGLTTPDWNNVVSGSAIEGSEMKQLWEEALS